MIPLLTLVTGPFGKIAAYAAAAVAVVVLALTLVREHDNRIHAEDAAAVAQATAQARVQAAEAGAAAVAADAQATLLRAQEATQVQQVIAHAAPPPQTCPAPAALGAALGMLKRNP